MAIQIVKTFTVKAPADAVWSFLIDPRKVAGCMPGAAITSQVDDRTFTGTMTVKVGPVTTSYKGKVVFEKLDAAGKAAEIVATGQDVKGKGGASMKLSSSLVQLSPAETEITTTSDLTITGILAQMGRGMIQDVSDEMFDIFSRNMRSELESAASPAPARAPAPTAAERDTAAASGEVATTAATVDAETETREAEAGTVESAARGMASSARAAGAGAAPRADVLDLGGIGARAASRAAMRTLTRPLFWLVLVVTAGLVYLAFIR
ncbi:MAG TPA: SRPBCC family protein [Kofleriaceae bacterium]|nr:SRPBCC family protein [Kofleriaceae bacterium]